MATTENSLPENNVRRDSVPHVDLAKAASVKRNRNKNNNSTLSTPSNSYSRKPMGNLNRPSGQYAPLGLLSPPASKSNVLSGDEQSLDRHLDHASREREWEEDPSRHLISPPPEEELQLENASRRSSFHKPSISHLNNITDPIASSSIGLHAKRKRSMAPTFSYTSSSSTAASGTAAQVTPNPKPRKQVRKSHVRTHSNQSDISMESPSRGPTISVVRPSSPSIQSSPSRRRRQQSKILRSPHVNNPNADYFPPFRPTSVEEPTDIDEENLLWPHVRSPMRRRSATPAVVPPYEPPAVVFTPPREVVISPIASVSRSRTKRKMGKTKGLKLDITVKPEPPDDDYIQQPMPPASPTDDPLLLSGPPDEDFPSPRRRLMCDASVSAEAPAITRTRASSLPQIPSFSRLPQNSPPTESGISSLPHPASVRQQESLPPSSPPARDISSPTTTFHFQDIHDDDRSTDSMDMDMQPHEYDEVEGGIPTFFGLGDLTGADGWSDSDDDDERPPGAPEHEAGFIDEGVGEFTGRWRLLQLPTKRDPPSSATRMRQEEWGNPISPYPYQRPSSRDGPRVGSASPSPSPVSQSTTEVQPVATNVPPPQEEEEDHTVTISRSHAEDEAEEEEVRAMSIEPPSALQAGDDSFEDEQEHDPVRVMDVEPLSTSQEAANDLMEEVEDEEAQEEQEVRALSLPLDEEEEEVEEEEEEAEEVRLVEEETTSAEVDRLQRQELELDVNDDDPSMAPEHAYARTSPISHTPLHTRSLQVQSSPAPLRDLSFLGRTYDKQRKSARASASFERAAALFGIRPKATPLKPSSALPEVLNEDDEMDSVNVLPQAPLYEQTVPSQQRSTEEEVEAAEEGLRSREEDTAEISGDDSDSDPTFDDPGLVQITSSDPKAAARAAAILKQHDYDCFTKIVLKQQQQRRRESESFSHSTVDGLKRDNRRKTLAGAGISKGKAPTTARRSLGTVVGDKVYIPGSPVMTLGGLLEEAEKEVQSKGLTPRESAKPTPSPFKENMLVGMGLGNQAALHTPLSAKYRSRLQSTLVHEVLGEEDESEEPRAQSALTRRDWTKEEWKILDGCFTDERIELASRTQPGVLMSTINNGDDEDIPIVGVDLVDIDNVVERFVADVGGEEVVEVCGWSRESLRARAKAIQNKQRAGHVAPPTTPYTPRSVSQTRLEPINLEVPDFTPSDRRPFPTARKWFSLLSPAGPAAPFSNIPDNLEEQPRRPRVPASLLAPRYSHLLDEAVAISRELPTPELNSNPLKDVDVAEASSNTSMSLEDISVTPNQPPETDTPQRQTSLGRLFSYIPGFSKTPARNSKTPRYDMRPGLPLPPAELLEKPRGPVVTPARPEVPKPKPPKDLVNLNHQPVPEQKDVSRIPKRAPKRLTDLKHIEPPEQREVVVPAVRPRRSSGSSVKDLINDFESIDSRSKSLTRAKSIGNWKKGIPGGEKSNRPTWKP